MSTFILGMAAANFSIFGPMPKVASPGDSGTPVPIELLDATKSKVVCVGFEEHRGRPGHIPPGILKKLGRDQPQSDEQFPGFCLVRPVYREHCYTVAE